MSQDPQSAKMEDANVKTPVEETGFKVADESAEQPKQERAEGAGEEGRSKRGFRIPGMKAGREVAQQLIRPWFDATSVTLDHVHDLQLRLLSRTQDAVKETFGFINEGVEQCTNMTQRTHKAMQDQLKRFGSR